MGMHVKETRPVYTSRIHVKDMHPRIHIEGTLIKHILETHTVRTYIETPIEDTHLGCTSHMKDIYRGHTLRTRIKDTH